MYLSIDEAVSSSWAVLKNNLVKIIGFFLAIALISILNWALIAQLGSQVFTQIESWVFGAFIQAAVITFTLNFYRKRRVKVVDRIKNLSLILRLLLGNFLSAILILAGLIFLIVPGIVLAVRLQFVSFLIVEKRLGPVEAIKKSLKITKNNFFALLGLSIVSLLINLLGLVLLLVGLLVTIPLTSLINARVYQKLSESSSA